MPHKVTVKVTRPTKAPDAETEGELVQIVINTDGTLCFLHDDRLCDLLSEGEVRIERASHVEPDEAGLWRADLSPVAGPVLGPYPLRQQALDAEASWLRRHRL